MPPDRRADVLLLKRLIEAGQYQAVIDRHVPARRCDRGGRSDVESQPEDRQRRPDRGMSPDGSGRAAVPLDPVEDQVEHELVCALPLAPESGEVLLGVLAQVRVLVGAEPAEELRRQLAEMLGVDDAVTELPQREAEDVRCRGRDTRDTSARARSRRRAAAGASSPRAAPRRRGHACRATAPSLQAQRMAHENARAPRSRAGGARSSSPRRPSGSSISPTTTSTIPSRMSPLFWTWLYSDIASTPSAWASLRMLSDSMPPDRPGDRGRAGRVPCSGGWFGH